MSARELADYLGISARTIGRLEKEGVLERERNGKFDVKFSMRCLLAHYMQREQWAYARLRRFRIIE